MEKIFKQSTREEINREFEWVGEQCYLDFAGAGLYSSRQIGESNKDLCEALYGNPHSLNDVAKLSRDAIDRVRSRILDFFHTNGDDYTVIFTGGATAAIKLLLESFDWLGNDEEDHGNEQWYEAVEGPGSFVYTTSNHTSVVGGRTLAQEKGASVICLPDKTAEDICGDNTPSSCSACCCGYNSTCYGYSNSLFAYPAQCNFSGKKFPLEWLHRVKNGCLNDHPNVTVKKTRWYCLLDAATFCSTNDLNLSEVHPDFVCISFYKIFGYPTGLGALLVRNSSACCLRKRYFGGGTVDVIIPSNFFVRSRKSLQQRFEDGTLPYLSIISLSHGFNTLSRLGLTMHAISQHVYALARHTSEMMAKLRHYNGKSLVLQYCDFKSSAKTQGGIVTFNLLRSDGSFIGYMEVLKVANSHKIQLRTGCFCNIGACQNYLGIDDSQLVASLQSGHVCGDEMDLIDGKPTGAVRVSFGYPSSMKEVELLLRMLAASFIEIKPARQVPCAKSLERRLSLKSIQLYPVKSCGAMSVSKWRVTSRGLDMDRNWMIVSSNGACVTQKEEPLLCRVMPVAHPDTRHLTLTFGGLDRIEVKALQNEMVNDALMCSNKVCADRLATPVLDCGDEVSAWLSKHLKRSNLRLVQQENDTRQTPTHQHPTARSDQPSTVHRSLANQGQYLLINEASVDWLKERLQDEDLNLGTLQNRFRANFTISGSSAFEELEWQQVAIGKLKLKVDGACTRCQMICIDQSTGAKNAKPLVELSRAQAQPGKLRFGIYCSHLDCQEGTDVSVGDLVNIFREF